LEKLILEQYKYLFSEGRTSAKEEKLLRDLDEKIKNLDNLRTDPTISSDLLPLGLSATYWRSLMAYNQLVEIKTVNAGILVLQGERDYQVTMEDFQLWKNTLKNNDRANFRSYSKLNHLFLEGENLSFPSEYEIEGQIPEYVIQDIAEWILNIN
jgi:fermentation-respiration switch protein FrsA (DUF1100 family)